MESRLKLGESAWGNVKGFPMLPGVSSAKKKNEQLTTQCFVQKKIKKENSMLIPKKRISHPSQRATEKILDFDKILSILFENKEQEKQNQELKSSQSKTFLRKKTQKRKKPKPNPKNPKLLISKYFFKIS